MKVDLSKKTLQAVKQDASPVIGIVIRLKIALLQKGCHQKTKSDISLVASFLTGITPGIC